MSGSPPITGDNDLDAYLYDLQLNLDSIGTTGTSGVAPGEINSTYYPEQYIQIRYANDNIGTDLSLYAADRKYYGVYNSITTTASNNPADYTWYEVAGGFGDDKFLFHTVLTGRNLKLYIGDSAPNSYWSIPPTTYIDLDVISEGFIDNTYFASGYEPVAIVNGLPNPATYTGPKIVYDTVTNKMYRWQDGQWWSNVLAGDIEGALAFENFSNSLRPVEIVSALPTAGNFFGRVVILMSDSKLYRYSETGWTASVPAVDIVGTLTNSQLADIAAAKITGQITTTQITDNAISTAKINAGAISTAKLAAGAVTADTIASNAITAVKIATNAIESDKIAANAITAGKLAADSVTAGVISAGAITSDKLASNSIIAGKIAAGVVTATEIDSRNLTIKDAAGNIILGSGTNLDWSRISSQPSGIYNSNVTINSNGTLSNAGGGQVSLGGLGAGSFATLSQINSSNISTYIASAAIGTAQIGNAAITNALIAEAAIGTAQIGNAAITNAKIADAQITTAKIADAQITTAKISDAQITTAKIGDLQVSTLKIGDNAVTIPSAAYTEGGVVPGWSGYGNPTVIQSISFTSSGAPKLINFCANYSAIYQVLGNGGETADGAIPYYTYGLYRNGTLLTSGDFDARTANILVISYVDNATAGFYNYELRMGSTDTFYTGTITKRAMSILEVKK
jgi:hypothetical protein